MSHSKQSNLCHVSENLTLIRRQSNSQWPGLLSLSKHFTRLSSVCDSQCYSFTLSDWDCCAMGLSQLFITVTKCRGKELKGVKLYLFHGFSSLPQSMLSPLHCFQATLGGAERESKTRHKGLRNKSGPLKVHTSVTYFIQLCPPLVAMYSYEFINEAIDRSIH